MVNRVRIAGSSAGLDGGTILFEDDGGNAVWNMKADSDGVIGIGTGATGSKMFQIKPNGNIGMGEGHSADDDFKLDVDGTVHSTGDVLMFSDGRVKRVLGGIESPMDKALRLHGVRYERTDGDENVKQKPMLGFIAQEVRDVVPEAVHDGKNPEDIMSVSYTQVGVLTLEALKEAYAEIQSLKRHIEILERKSL